VEDDKGNSGKFEIVEKDLQDDILTLKVKVDAEIVSRAYRKVHKALLKQVRVPGFRPGKVPLQVLSNAVGRENFIKEVRKELLPEYYYSALQTTPYRPISNVSYADERLANGEPFAFSAKVSVFPEGKLSDYASLTVKAPAPKPVDGDEIEKVLRERQKKYAKTRSAEDGTVADGDYALLSFTVSIDGREYRTLSRTNHTMFVGEDAYLPGFDANLLGQKKGEEFTFAFELPKRGLDNKALQGKKAMVKGKVKAVQRVELPRLDDEFAKDLGDFATLDDFKRKIRSDLEKEHERSAREAFVDELKKALVDAIDVQFPASLLDREAGDRVAEMKSRFEGKPYTFDDYLHETGKDEASVRAERREQVVFELKMQCALDEVAAREGLNVTDEEFGQKLEALGQMLHKDPEEILETLDANGRRLIQRQEMVREKAFDRVRDIARGR
jgi:trigger factor